MSTPAAPPVAVVSDALVDIIETDEGESWHPGGAGLNVAVGVRRLGLPARLAYPVAHDDAGAWLRTFLTREGVEVIPLPGTATGIARSRRVGQTPEYRFNGAVHKRTYTYPDAARRQLAPAAVLCVNSFPMGDPAQIDQLLALLRDQRHELVVDPNARPTLVDTQGRYLAGLLALAARASLVKLSEEDIDILFGTEPVDAVERLLAAGAGAVVVTRGARGATAITPRHAVHAPAVDLPGPVIDTLGAGDAVLAHLAATLATDSGPRTAAYWHGALTGAMRLAAATCRVVGGIPPAEALTTRSS